MTYTDWFSEHSIIHKAIMEQLKDKSIDEIIEYFEYENMRINHPDFCPLYASNSKCHDMKDLNCYMCGCPHFRFNDAGIEIKENKVVYSLCTKGLGESFESENAIHQDCSNCTLPHKVQFIKKNFNVSWSEMMEDVIRIQR
ncbi:MAG: hypothetical protein JXQ77_00985 [Campylobacterales bacterium]|nr:hypothetical protein [Campylobacterales bacterium]